MSGLELFLDGGATFAGLLSAGAVVVGYKQQKEDDSELVEDEEELEILRKNLSEATTSACAAHTALTVAWGQPLSLFKGDMSQISWATEAVDMAKGLVELAAELEDLADVYDAQLHLAISKRRSLLRWPLGRLEAKLEEMQLVLTAQIPAVVLAKEAMAFGTKAMKPVQAETAIEAARSFGSFDQVQEGNFESVVDSWFDMIRYDVIWHDAIWLRAMIWYDAVLVSNVPNVATHYKSEMDFAFVNSEQSCPHIGWLLAVLAQTCDWL